MTRSLLIIIAVAIAPRIADAACSAGSVPAVPYLEMTNTSSTDTRSSPDPNAPGTYHIKLMGYARFPTTSAPHPLIIFNHGSEDCPGEKLFMNYFVNAGYAVFVPHRRGHGESTGTTLTEYRQNVCTLTGSDIGERCGMEYLHLQTGDIQAAIDFMKTNGAIDDDRIYLMGHSYGALVSMFSNQYDMGHRAVVSVAGGSQSWDPGPPSCPTDGTAGPVECELPEATTAGVKPIYFFEAANDVSIQPTIQGAKAAGLAGKAYQSAIFPVVCQGACDYTLTGDDFDFGWRNTVHGGYMSMTSVYGPSVIDFFVRQSATIVAPTCTATPEERIYDKVLWPNPSSTDTRCEFDAVTGQCTKIELRGWLYKPPLTFTGERPLVVYHHGKDDNPGQQCAVADWFRTRGYVVFVPHRRGAGLSTGPRISTMTSAGISYHYDHASDVKTSVAWARNLTRPDGSLLVDASRIGVIGHSMGGNAALLATKVYDMGISAVVAISAGALTWGSNPQIRTHLIDAVENAIEPVFLLQPLDDASIEPTITLAQKAAEVYAVHQSALYPVVGANAHNVFPSTRLDLWAPTAAEFIERN